MADLDYDVIICGSGLAGLRAAIEAASFDQKLRIVVVSKLQVMRSHSVSAEGGTAAVIFPEEGTPSSPTYTIPSRAATSWPTRTWQRGSATRCPRRYTVWTTGACLGPGVKTAA